jgi:2-keto-4-pentenoate hydratase/2-oxohepta-3-ene-1,7-dioic acid hydratase in catechol pathway
MKAGRYLLNGNSRLFFVRGNGQLLDWGALEQPGVPDDVRRLVSRALPDCNDDAFCHALPYLARFLASGARVVEQATALAQPIDFEPPVRPRNFICVGLNYRDHAAETALKLPQAPLLFAKTANAINAHNRPVPLPLDSTQIDYEAELAVVIGRPCHRVSAADALAYVAGYTCGNDVSARDFQFGESQWYRGKSADGFGPLGPWIVTPDEISDVGNLRIQLRLNGRTMQDSTTADLVFGVAALIEYISRYITMVPGDVILTGTPPGVGFTRKPPVFLKAGDNVEVEVEAIGVLANTIASSR